MRLGHSVVHRDRDDSAERQSADVGAVDPELGHGGEDHRRIIVARGAFGRAVAVPIAGIIERDGAAFFAEMLELWPPHGFVRADSVEEDDRRVPGPKLSGAGFVIADRNAGGGFHPGHVLLIPSCWLRSEKLFTRRHEGHEER